MRIIAVDWSGASAGATSKMWLAEVDSGELIRLESGRDRTDLIAHLIAEARKDPDLVVGLDFAFSFPEWFATTTCEAASIEDVWSVVSKRGEEWLDACEPPFWGRRKGPRPDVPAAFRRTEQAASEPTGSQPKSVFQIGGPGHVGTGSIRGMPHLSNLRAAGFSIWPFHDVSIPLVVEIYPRLLTGPVTKSNAAARAAYLRDDFPEIPPKLETLAATSEDAFDAAVSAVVMARHADELRALTGATDPTELLEGRIWWPEEVRGPVSPQARPEQSDYPFCAVDVDALVQESRHSVALRDRYPVSPGHTLVVPRTHVASVYDLTPAAQADLWDLVAAVRAELSRTHEPDGFNIGINDGPSAGQTVGHAHIHVIPRYEGDVRDPRGGIRWVIPERAPYWDR